MYGNDIENFELGSLFNAENNPLSLNNNLPKNTTPKKKNNIINTKMLNQQDTTVSI